MWSTKHWRIRSSFRASSKSWCGGPHELVWRDARLPAKRVFSSIGKVKFEVDLFAVAVFQNAHYTAFVRARDGSDSWTYHDRRSAVAVGTFANVVQRCRDGPMLPYLLFYDSLTAAPGA